MRGHRRLRQSSGYGTSSQLLSSSSSAGMGGCRRRRHCIPPSSSPECCCRNDRDLSILLLLPTDRPAAAVRVAMIIPYVRFFSFQIVSVFVCPRPFVVPALDVRALKLLLCLSGFTGAGCQGVRVVALYIKALFCLSFAVLSGGGPKYRNVYRQIFTLRSG